MHIGIVIWSLFETRGGIERNGCELARAMLSRGHTVNIFYKRPKRSSAPVYPVPEGAALYPLQLDFQTRAPLKNRNILIQSHIDVLVAIFSWDSLLWFPWLLQETGIPLLVSERSAPERLNRKWNSVERYACLNAADAIHVLSPSFMQAYPNFLQSRITAIPNPVLMSNAAQPARTAPSTRKTLLAAGRLEDGIKQFSLLIEAFADLAPRFPDWDLRICGDGTSKREYLSQINALNLETRITLPGMRQDMHQEYAQADLFCIPSKSEGFGMVTVEAQFHALAAVGFAACPGTNEIIVHGENGLLAPEMNAISLAESLSVLMQDSTKRLSYGNQGKAMLDRYDAGRVFDAWERLLLQTAACHPTRIEALRTGHNIPSGAATLEILARTHPYDRRAYITAAQRGDMQHFTAQDIRGFQKKQKKYGLCGARKILRTMRFPFV